MWGRSAAGGLVLFAVFALGCASAPCVDIPPDVSTMDTGIGGPVVCRDHHVVLTLKDGRRIEGVVVAVSKRAVAVSAEGEMEAIAWSDVDELATRTVSGGFGIKAAAAFGASALVVAGMAGVVSIIFLLPRLSGGG